MQMYNYRIKKYVGAYAAAMGGVDLIIFTGGVGENQCSTRLEVCKEMAFMGIEIDEAVNNGMRGQEKLISKPESRVKVMVVPTDEEYMIAKDTYNLTK